MGTTTPNTKKTGKTQPQAVKGKKPPLPKRDNSKTWAVVFALFVCIVFLIKWDPPAADAPEPAKQPEQTIAKNTPQPTTTAPFSLEITDADIHDSPAKTQLILKGYIPADIQKVTPADIENALAEQFKHRGMWTAEWLEKKMENKQKLKDFEKWYGKLAPNDIVVRTIKGSERTHFTHYFVYAFLSEEDTSSLGSWVGRLEWIDGTQDEPKIEIREEQLAAAKAPDNKKYGLPIATRKQIRKELWTVTVTAEKRATSKYPSDIMRQIDYERAITSELKSGVAKKYGLTLEQLDDVYMEGVMNNWPRN